ncbi:Uncharacterized protein TCAP_07104, partial [Tolypocladium capitatum]
HRRRRRGGIASTSTARGLTAPRRAHSRTTKRAGLLELYSCSFHSTRLHDQNTFLHLHIDHGKHLRMLSPQRSSIRPATPRRRKRRIPSSSPVEDEPAQRSSKKQKLEHPAFPPARFWDNLSEIPLTQNAIRELDERNTEVSRDSARTRNIPRRHTSIQETSRLQRVDRFLDRCSPACLKRIERFARHGGSDLRDIRGYQTPAEAQDGMSSGQSSLGRRKRGSQSPKKTDAQLPSKINATPNTASTRSTGPYDRTFQQHLVDHNILPLRYKYPDGRLPPEPNNMDEIHRALAQPRASLSPSKFTNDDFRKFEEADVESFRERQVMTKVIPILEGNVGDGICVAGEIPFTNLDHLTDGTLVPGNPDLYYGARPEQLDRSIRGQLNGKIVPSTQHDLPIAPNFSLQVKGLDGSLSVALRQACYDGALGARGIHSLQSYGQSEPQYDNKAYNLTSIYHGGTLKMFTSHPIPPSAPGEQPGFAMTPVNSWSVTGNYEAFRQGAAAYRNGRDWARQQRDRAIEQANERASRDDAAASPQGGGLGLSFANEVGWRRDCHQPRDRAEPRFQSTTIALRVRYVRG